MVAFADPTEPLIIRQVFPSWWIGIPPSFDETFVAEGGGYWHGWDAHRSVSMTSYVIEDDNGPVPAAAILDEVRGLELEVAGTPVEEMPPGHLGRASWGPVPNRDEPARASHVLGGVLVMDGRAAVVTITTDDEAWARQTWLSIRGRVAPDQGRQPAPNRSERRRAARTRGRGMH